MSGMSKNMSTTQIMSCNIPKRETIIERCTHDTACNKQAKIIKLCNANKLALYLNSVRYANLREEKCRPGPM